METYSKRVGTIFEVAKKRGASKDIFYTDSLWEIIFDHEFAKKFFGEQMLNGHCGKNSQDYEDKDCCYYASQSMEWFIPSWQYHLQKMVISTDPISYLEKFL